MTTTIITEFLAALAALPEDCALRRRLVGEVWGWVVEQDGQYSFDADYPVSSVYDDPRDAVAEASAYTEAMAEWDKQGFPRKPFVAPEYTAQHGRRLG